MLDRVRPDVVVGYGGYVSVPAYLAARRRRLPLVVHEQNALPGLANKVGARIADRVAVSFPDTRLPHAEYVGLPIRHDDLPARPGRAARRGPGVLRPRPGPADAGGDRRLPGCAQHQQGGRRRRPRRWARPACRCCTWSAPRTTWSPPSRPARPTSSAFVDRMDYALAAADLMVCRAGASSVTEAAAVGVPAVFVPLPIGNGEQALNARPVVDAGGALLVADADVHHRVGHRARPGAGHRRGPAGRDERRGSGLIPRDADEKLARIILETRRGELMKVAGAGGAARRPTGSAACTSSVSAAPACPRSPGSCWPAASRSAAATASRSPALDALRALGARVYVGHAAEQLGDAETVVVSTAVREDNPEYVEAVAPRPAGAAPLGCAGRGDGRPPRDRGGRHPRQDHDDRAADRGPAGGRRGPDVRRRRRPDRDRGQRGGGQRRPVRRRGRRERRRLPRLPAVRSDRHQHRGRPPRPLGDRGGLRRGVRRVRVDSVDPDGFLVCCVDDAGARRAGRAAARRPAGAWSPCRPGPVSPTSGPRRWPGCSLWSPGRPLPGRRAAALAAGRTLGLRRRRPASGASPPSPAPGGGWSARARPAASASTTAMPTTRPRSPATSRPPVRSRGRGGSSSRSSRTWSRAPGIFGVAMGEALGAADEVVVCDVYLAREDPDPDGDRRVGRGRRTPAPEHVAFVARPR